MPLVTETEVTPIEFQIPFVVVKMVPWVSSVAGVSFAGLLLYRPRVNCVEELLGAR